MTDIDTKVRLAAFKWLEEQCQIYGDTLPRKVLEQGFIFQSKQIHLIGPQGIFIPKGLSIPLTITTSPNSPYDDKDIGDGLFHYKYRGTDGQHRENKGLREAMIRKIPLIYLFGIGVGKYVPEWPVEIVEDNPSALTFTVAVDEKKNWFGESNAVKGTYPLRNETDIDAKRRYLTVQTRQRLHQQRFRERVLQAYQEQCAMCRLRHPELLEAIHIIPDSEPKGEPIVPNGISLCNLHHTAFDRFVLGIRPDYIIEVRGDILEEEDGPMLRHGLQALNNQKIILPRSRKDCPDPDRLSDRYEKFKKFILN
jgi:putative restriction endonuclease